jgi:hypothetical protein
MKRGRRELTRRTGERRKEDTEEKEEEGFVIDRPQ